MFNFDMEWLISAPGIFTCLGILLIIISIIIFLSSLLSGKEKKESSKKNDGVIPDNVSEPKEVVTNNEAVAVNSAQVIEPNTQAIQSVEPVTQAPVDNNVQAPIVNTVPTASETPSVQAVNVTPINNEPEVAVTPNVAPISITTPTIEPVAPVAVTPTVEPVAVTPQPTTPEVSNPEGFSGINIEPKIEPVANLNTPGASTQKDDIESL